MFPKNNNPWFIAGDCRVASKALQGTVALDFFVNDRQAAQRNPPFGDKLARTDVAAEAGEMTRFVGRFCCARLNNQER
jgi:hypothetical protein